MKKTILLVAFFLICFFSLGKANADLKSMEFSNFKSIEYIDLAIKLQSMKRQDAITRLTAYADSNESEFAVFVLCRMLFDPKEETHSKAKEKSAISVGSIAIDKPINGEKFRAPRLGKPTFIGDKTAWDRDPICIVDGVPFLIVKGYLLLGCPESAKSYLEYCINNMQWTKNGSS